MSLAELKKLAMAATQPCATNALDCPACNARRELQRDPQIAERVLALIAAIEAADAMWATPERDTYAAYASARAALD